jgi:PAS domain S-box-containing protein
MKPFKPPACNDNACIEKDKIEGLAKTFEKISQEAAGLEGSYITLAEQFQSLNFELQETNHALRNKVAELDIMAAYLRSILDNIAQGILFIDPQGTITTYNRAAEGILGIERTRVLSHSFWQNFKDDALGFSMKESLKNKENFGSPCTNYITPSGNHIDLEVATTFVLPSCEEPLAAASAPTQGILVMIKDVTEVRHLQILASRADRMKELGEMAAQVAHEIRNPLGGIKGYASLLKRDLKAQPELQQMAESIVEGTDHLSRLVNQVLLYARPMQPRFENTDLAGALQEIKTYVLADPNIGKQKISISIDSPADKIFLPIDRTLFRSAMLNLIVNSIQAMPEGGKISFTIKQQPNHIILNISDTGVGISQEHLSKLYSPFFTTKSEGNGLGLAEVQKVIQAHNGTIDVSSAVGEGTTFIIKIPLRQRFL